MANKEDDVSGLSSRLTEAAEMQVGQGALSGQDMKGGGPPVGSNADDLTENEDDSHNVEGDGPERNGFDAPELNRSRRQGGRGGIISLKMLIDDEIIVPGEDVLTVDYKEYSYTASLLPDGRIYFVVEQERMYFESPSAFSVFVKRITNPTRKADDGWKSVKYEGRLLEQYKAEYARKRLGDDSLLDDTFEPYTKRLRKDRLQSLHTPREVNRRLFSETVPRIQRHASPRFASLGADDESNCQSIDPFDPEKQPFKLKVSPVAEIVMDFHSHLSMTGTIGLLGGTWDVVTKTLEIQRTFPIRELPATEECSHVEMDPEDKSSTMWEAANAGLKIVGWYHSHPTFSRSPTTIDVYNQVLEQHAQRETEAEGAALIYEPYVGAIICPFDVKEKKATSEIMWYYVEHAAGIVPSDGQRPEEVGCLARSFVPEPISNPLYGLENLASMQRELENLSKRYAQYKYRTELEAWWTGDVSVAEKLVKSLLSRLPPALGESKISKFAEKVLFSTRAVWNIYGASMSHMVKDSMTSPQIDPDAKSDILCVTSVRRSGDDAGTAQNVGDRVGEPISEEDEETEEE